MKKIIKDFLYHLLIILFGMSLFFSLSHINPLVINNSEPKEGDIVVLGDNGSMRLAKLEDIDNHELGMIISTDTISLEVAESLYIRDTAIVECIVPESMYYNGIKVEVGQVWACCKNELAPPILVEITDIKDDNIYYFYYTNVYRPCTKNDDSLHKDLFFKEYPKLISPKGGCVTMKGKVSNINTSDLKD